MTSLTHIGEFVRYRWRNNDDDSPWAICVVVDPETKAESTVAGPVRDGELCPGITYEFYASGAKGTGWVEHAQHGASFKFSLYTVKVPLARFGVIKYLTKYGKGIGDSVAARIYDAFGNDAVKILRTEPKRVSEAVKFFPLHKALESAKLLSEMAVLEETKIGLTNLFADRGFPGSLIEECVKLWKVQAPARITRDPFTLLVHDLTGCGFGRCDRLYTDLGLPADRLKRQMICVWHSLHADTTGNTWTKADVVVQRLRQAVSGTKLNPKKAIKLGLRSGWLAKYRDADGVLWLAEGDRARDERFVAEQLKLLGSWRTADTTELRTLIHVAESSSAPMAVA